MLIPPSLLRSSNCAKRTGGEATVPSRRPFFRLRQDRGRDLGNRVEVVRTCQLASGYAADELAEASEVATVPGAIEHRWRVAVGEKRREELAGRHNAHLCRAAAPARC